MHTIRRESLTATTGLIGKLRNENKLHSSFTTKRHHSTKLKIIHTVIEWLQCNISFFSLFKKLRGHLSKPTTVTMTWLVQWTWQRKMRTTVASPRLDTWAVFRTARFLSHGCTTPATAGSWRAFETAETEDTYTSSNEATSRHSTMVSVDKSSVYNSCGPLSGDLLPSAAAIFTVLQSQVRKTLRELGYATTAEQNIC